MKRYILASPLLGLAALLAGSPVATGAAPQTASLWPNAAVRITKGEDQLGSYAKTPASIRRWCRHCGGQVLTEHPAWGLIDVYAAVIEGFNFAPGVHVHYQETVLPIHDGVTKLKDLPQAMGGSGAEVSE